MRQGAGATRVRWGVDAVGALFCIGLSALAYFCVLSPLMLNRGAMARQRAEVELKRRTAARLHSSCASIERKLEVVQKQLAEGGVELQPARQVNRRAAELTEMTSGCGLEVGDIRLGELMRATEYDVVPIRLAGNGGYKSWAKFLHALSTAFPDTGVASFAVSASSPNNDQGEFRCELFWYAAREMEAR